MANKNIIRKNKSNVLNLILLFVLFLFLSLIIPAIGIGASSPAAWVTIVEFFEAVRTHFTQYWMFYSFGGVVLFAYVGRR